MVAKLAKAALALLQSEKGRKILKSIVIIALSPLILILIFIVSAGSGASEHNNHLIDVVFLNQEASTSAPPEHQQFIDNYKLTFSKIDSEIKNTELSQGQLDSVLIKSVLFVSYLESENNTALLTLDIPQYLVCFITTHEDGTTEPITSTDEALTNVSSFLNQDLTPKKEMIYEIYRVVLTGTHKDFDPYVPLASLLEDAYKVSKQSAYIGGTFVSPLEDDWRPYVTSEFGPRDPIHLPDGSVTSDFHSGIDFGRPLGTPLYAVGDGKIVLVRHTDVGLGFYVVIDHGGGIFTVYGHMSRISVSENQTVTQGQLIGEVGSTGYSTGAHLHFEVIVNRRHINPRLYLN